MKTFRELRVWQAAHTLVLHVYAETRMFPRHEQYGLTSQLRRATVSVAANIVEGHRRTSRHELLNFLNIADASLEEAKYLLFLAHDLRYVQAPIFEECTQLCDVVGGMLGQFKRHVRQEVSHASS